MRGSGLAQGAGSYSRGRFVYDTPGGEEAGGGVTLEHSLCHVRGGHGQSRCAAPVGRPACSSTLSLHDFVRIYNVVWDQYHFSPLGFDGNDVSDMKYVVWFSESEYQLDSVMAK